MSGSGTQPFEEVTSVENETDSSTESTLRQTDAGAQAARTLFLIIFIVIGFAGNTVLVATIAQSTRLRKTTLNLFILGVASANILDSVVNLPLILGASLLEEWNYGSFVCQLNACCLQLTSIAMLLGLMMMTLDRLLAFRDLSGNECFMTPMKANLLIVYTWTHALALSLVLLIKIVPVAPHPAGYLCLLSAGANLTYVCFVSVIGYIVPLLVIVALFVCIIRICISEKLKEINSSSRHAYNDDSDVENDRLWFEINASKLIGILLIFWCVLEGPFLLVMSINNYTQSTQLSKGSNKTEVPFPWQLETTITWLRLSYVMVLPVVSFFWRKEVWKKLKKHLTCKKDNLIKNIAPKKDSKSVKEKQSKEKTPNTESRISLRSKKANEKENKELSLSNGSVPVLFATANGLHYQNPGVKQEEMESDDNATEPDTTDTTLTQVLTSRKCDVVIGGDETSDYDSQVEDPFATSNPISVRSKNSNSEYPVARNKGDGQTGNLYDEYTGRMDQFQNENRKRNKWKRRNSREHQIELKQNGNDRDSGTESIRAKRKTKTPNDSLDHVNGNLESAELDVNKMISKDEILKPKRKKKRKKKRQTDVERSNDVELSEKGQSAEKHLPYNGQPPPRLLPKLDIQTNSSEALFDRVSDHERSKNIRPLPELSSLKTNPRPYRQLSENAGEQCLLQNGVQSDRLYKKQYSADDTVRPQSARPTPSPRKSATKPLYDDYNKNLLQREKSESQAQLLQNGVYSLHTETEPLPASKAKRKKRVDV